MKFLDLENYDGNKAYFDRERYVVLEIEGTKYAFPADTDVIRALEQANGIERERLEKLFPIFQIVNEDIGPDTARAVQLIRTSFYYS